MKRNCDFSSRDHTSSGTIFFFPRRHLLVVVFLWTALLTFTTTVSITAASAQPTTPSTMNMDNNDSNSSSAATATMTVLVVGATGATGKHVVHQLLHQGHRVKAIVRSKQRLVTALQEIDDANNSEKNNKKSESTSALEIVETDALLDYLSSSSTSSDFQQVMADVDAVVSCLGHVLDLNGIYGEPRKLVTDATSLLTKALLSESSKAGTNKNEKRFVLMGSDGVANPAGTDDVRSFGERVLLSIIRFLLPPHRDNEAAAQFLHDTYGPNADNSNLLQWVVVRPTDLIDENPEDGSMNDQYTLTPKPVGSLFGSGNVATRSNVARTMVDLLTKDALWDEWKFQMPCMCDKVVDIGESTTKEL